MPEGRGKMCAAYDPSGAIIVCGGGERFWRPNANCWQLLAGAAEEWQDIPQMYPVHGAAVAFFRGKFWVFGGSTGDDSYDHTITDKVFFRKLKFYTRFQNKHKFSRFKRISLG